MNKWRRRVELLGFFEIAFPFSPFSLFAISPYFKEIPHAET